MGDCPGPPNWVTIPASGQEIWRPANQKIEEAYKAAKSGHRNAILVASDFLYGGKENPDIRLPKGAPNKEYGNHLLAKLRGLKQQLKPDIVDFEERVFYEIKTKKTANRNPGEVKDQLANCYRVAEAARVEYGVALEPEWKQKDARWKPPSVLPFDLGEKIVCTAATDYEKWPHGLVLYDVRQKADPDREKKKREVKRIAVEAIDGDFAVLLPEPRRMGSVLKPFDPFNPEFVVIAPAPFYATWKKQVQQEKHDRQLDVMRVPLPPFLDGRNPIGGFRNLGWTMVGATTVALSGVAIVASAYQLLAAGGIIATTGTGTAAGAGTAGGAEIISMAAYKAMTVSRAAKTLAAAAGVIAVVGTPRRASAGGTTSDSNRLTIHEVGAVRLVPVETFKWFVGLPAASTDQNVPGDPDFFDTSERIQAHFKPGSVVSFDWTMHKVVARFRVEYNAP